MSTVRKVKVDGIVYDVEDTDARAKAEAAVASYRQVRQDLNSVSPIVAPMFINVLVIDDNPGTTIKSDGTIANTASAIGTSDAYACKEGQTIRYTLSSESGRLIFAVYDADMNLTHSVAGNGYSAYISGEYTFTSNDAYFHVSGVTGGNYRKKYALAYSFELPNVATKAEAAAALFMQPTESKSLLTIGGGISLNGEINIGGSVPSTYRCSDFIALKKGSVIDYKNVRVTNLCAIACYDQDKAFDAESSVVATTTISGSWTMPFDGFVRLCCLNERLLDNTASFIINNPASASINALDARVNALEDVLPDNWESYLEAKKPAIRSALVEITDCGEAITFVTDCHIPRNNLLTPRILRKLAKTCPVNYHLNGGDFIDINRDGSQYALDKLWAWREAMSWTKEYIVRGNHDTNNYDGSNADNALTTGQFYAIMNRQIESEIDTGGKTYFCLDNVSQKIRIILLDTSLPDKTEMYAWFETRLTELDSAWTILIVQHYLWGSTTASISGPGQATIDTINAVYSQIRAPLIGILAGHTHVDHHDLEPTHGYHLIARDANITKNGTGTDSLSIDFVTINTVARTINFLKIGRGEDLSLNY